MPPFLSSLGRALGRLDTLVQRLERLLAGGLLLAGVAVLLADIALRALAGIALPWANEAARYAIIWLVLIAGSIGARQGAHISIDLLAELASPRLARLIARVAAAISALTAALMAWIGMSLAMQMRAFGQTSPALEWPMWGVYLAVPIGASLMALRFAQAALSPPTEAEMRARTALSAA